MKRKNYQKGCIYTPKGCIFIKRNTSISKGNPIKGDTFISKEMREYQKRCMYIKRENFERKYI